MVFLNHTATRKLTALALTGLLLVIYTVKLFHSHYNSTTKDSVASTYSNSSKSFPIASHTNTVTSVCVICDFVLLRDADNVQQQFIIQQPACYPEYNAAPAVSTLSSSRLVIADRGPPAVL